MEELVLVKYKYKSVHYGDVTSSKLMKLDLSQDPKNIENTIYKDLQNRIRDWNSGILRIEDIHRV